MTIGEVLIHDDCPDRLVLMNAVANGMANDSAQARLMKAQMEKNPAGYSELMVKLETAFYESLAGKSSKSFGPDQHTQDIVKTIDELLALCNA